MRPLKLEVEGFTAFRTSTCLNLEELDLFAITGPTGAGKSSLIDSICYALYGSVPRVTDEISSCISQGLDRMRVTLEFRTGEERYRVFRETRRKGAPNVRLDRQRGPDDWRTIAEGARDVTAKVVDTIGLDYNGFTRSVLLPQGQFQEFLAGSADKRRAVLRSLLSFDIYDRMRSRASTMAIGLEGRLKGLEHELESVVDATQENLDRQKAELEGRKSREQELVKQIESLSQGVELSQGLSKTRVQVENAQAAAEAAEAELAQTQALVMGGEDEVESFNKRLAAAQARSASNGFDPERHTALTLGLDRARNLQKCLEEIARLEAQRSEAESNTKALAKAAELAEKKQAASEAELEEAEHARRDAELHNLAAALQQGLKAGDPCPVCGGVVGDIKPAKANGIEAAQQREALARRAVVGARQALQVALAASTRASATSHSSGERFEALMEQRSELSNSLVEVLPDEEDITLPGLVAALNFQVEARKERQSIEAEVRDAETRLLRLTADLAQARQKQAALQQRSESAQRELELAQKAMTEAGERLLTLAIQNDWQNVAEAVGQGRDVSAGLKTQVAAAQAEHQQTLQAIGQSEARIARLTEDMERARILRKEHASLKHEHATAADLALMLQANRFQNFVQAEALETLAADGSRRLEQLSGGRYRLRVEDKGGEFEVIDQWNADQTRSVKTLSGGETFLASLALSLALAESLPGLAASRRVVLDSIFLDEGFGSLDAEALDRAADALDALRDENRMVCVVTHLQELAQRLPARIVVTKSESGSFVAID